MEKLGAYCDDFHPCSGCGGQGKGIEVSGEAFLEKYNIQSLTLPAVLECGGYPAPETGSRRKSGCDWEVLRDL